jgi:hypothetical protein
MAAPLEHLRPLVADGRRAEALDYLASTVRPTIDSLSTDAGELVQILDDLTAALSVSP